MFNSKIEGFQSYVPLNTISNKMLEKLVDTSSEWICSRTGILERRVTLGENTSDLATEVCNKLLKNANITASEIDLILVATITSDYMMPSTACIVQSNIGADNAVAFDINAACSGFVYALSVADKFIKSGTYKNALVVGSETLSKIVDWTDRGTCVLFGDGAGGVLLSSTTENTGILHEDIHSRGSSWKSLKGGFVPLINPFSQNQETNKKENKEDCKNDYYLNMNGREVFNFATKTVPSSIQKLLDDANISVDDIKYIVPHQANYRIIEVFAKKLNTTIDKFYLNLENYGNTSSASIPIALAEMKEKNLLNLGDKIVLTGFGAGLTWGSILITI